MKLLFRIIIPLCIIVCGLIIWSTQLTGAFSVLTYTHTHTVTQPVHGLLTQEKIVRGKFTSDNNYLGILWVDVKTPNTLNRSHTDKIVFRIREVGEHDWYYTAQYSSEVFYTLPHFPFGIPTIKDSQNKVYEYELISLYGTKEDAIKIPSAAPDLMVSYQYPKQQLLHNPTLMRSFIIQKIITIGMLPNAWYSLLVYCIIPLGAYVIWRRKSRESTEKETSKKSFMQLSIMVTLLAVIILTSLHIEIALALLLLLLEVILGLSAYGVIRLSVVFLFCAALALIWNNFSVANQYGQSAFILFIIGYIKVLVTKRIYG